MWFHIAAWVPLIVYVLVWIESSKYDGWGAWAAAPMFLVPIFLSLVLTFVGGLLVFRAYRSEQPFKPNLYSTIVAATPFLYTLLAALFS